MDEIDLKATPLGFAELVLGLHLYDWQATAVTWFSRAAGKRIKGSVCTPNGAGKDSIIIAALALWWVSVHRRGRVVITSKDARQIDEQTWPAISRHASKFGGWKWIDRECTTATGGRIIAFTTDDEARCEGFHRETGPDGKPTNEGPLLLIANEAKSIEEGIFTAFDRCTYDAQLYASSPGAMTGRFYESQFRRELGFKTIRVGLKDCPHIPKERIDDIIATHGLDSPFTKSTLFGEFMLADAQQRFNQSGMKRLSEMSAAADKEYQRCASEGRTQLAPYSFVDLQMQEIIGSTRVNALKVPTGFVWLTEPPTPGRSYIAFCDPTTGVQSEGGKDRDTCSAGVIRCAYKDQHGLHNAEVVAMLHAPDGVRWENDIVAERLGLLALWYGDCTIIVEMNNYGGEIIRLLQLAGRSLWVRLARDHRNPGKRLKTVGFQTTAASKAQWIGALGQCIREETLDCLYAQATSQFETFVLNEKGTGEAQSGAKDDHVTGIGLGLFAIGDATTIPLPEPMQTFTYEGVTMIESQGQRHGACA